MPGAMLPLPILTAGAGEGGVFHPIAPSTVDRVRAAARDGKVPAGVG